MSLDNVIGVAAAAKGSLLLLILGLAISIPLIIFASTFLLKIMGRFPLIITAGAALLGWVAGDMATTDPMVKDWVSTNAAWLHEAAEVLGAVLVVIVGKWLAAEAMLKRPALAELGKEGIPVPAAAAVPATGGLFNRILLPVDASDSAARAVAYVLAAMRQSLVPATMDLHLMNVQRGVQGDVSRFVSKESLDEYHRDNSVSAMARARKMLDDAGVKYSLHMLVGKPWEVISDYAGANHCDHVVMGTRGLGTYTGAAFGSVAQGVVMRSSVPVLLVK